METNSNQSASDGVKSAEKLLTESTKSFMDFYTKQLNVAVGFYKNMFDTFSFGKQGWNSSSNFSTGFLNNDLTKVFAMPFNGLDNSFTYPFSRSFDKLYKQLMDYNTTMFTNLTNGLGIKGDISEMNKKYQDAVNTKMESYKDILKSALDAYNKQLNFSIENNKVAMTEMNNQFNLILMQNQKFWLSEAEAYKILDTYGFNVLDYRVSNTIEECIEAAKQIGYPVVMKVLSPDILHKVDVGGVQLNLKNDNDIKNAFTLITANVSKLNHGNTIQGFLIQKYFTESGLEIIIGANAIHGFGSLIMFGLGGTLVGLFKDVAFRLAPLTKQDALNMIMKTKGYQLLKGYRGHSPYNIDGIVDNLLRLSQLVTDFPEIKEIDMNPLKVLNGGEIIVMDSKAILNDENINSSVLPKELFKLESV